MKGYFMYRNYRDELYHYAGVHYNYNELYHYGVKGMKWGVYKNLENKLRALARSGSSSSSSSSSSSEGDSQSAKEAKGYVYDDDGNLITVPGMSDLSSTSSSFIDEKTTTHRPDGEVTTSVDYKSLGGGSSILGVHSISVSNKNYLSSKLDSAIKDASKTVRNYYNSGRSKLNNLVKSLTGTSVVNKVLPYAKKSNSNAKYEKKAQKLYNTASKNKLY